MTIGKYCRIWAYNIVVTVASINTLVIAIVIEIKEYNFSMTIYSVTISFTE